MLFFIMSKDFAQSSELFEALVDGFMTGTDILFELLDGIAVELIWNDDGCMLLPTISQICLCLLLCLQQLLLQSSAKDIDIRECTTRERTIDPDDVAGLDAHRHLVPVA